MGSLPRDEKVGSLSRSERAGSLSRDQTVGSLHTDQKVRSLHRPEGGGHFQDRETEVSTQRSEGVVTLQS